MDSVTHVFFGFYSYVVLKTSRKCKCRYACERIMNIHTCLMSVIDIICEKGSIFLLWG